MFKMQWWMDGGYPRNQHQHQSVCVHNMGCDERNIFRIIFSNCFEQIFAASKKEVAFIYENICVNLCEAKNCS